MIAASSDSSKDCSVDPNPYALISPTPSNDSISLLANGTMKFNTFSVVLPKSYKISVTVGGGAQTVQSPSFSFEVIDCFS